MPRDHVTSFGVSENLSVDSATKFSCEHLLRPRVQLETPRHTVREQTPQENSPVALTTVSTQSVTNLTSGYCA